MIKFTLKCSRGHEFEAWFASSAEYARQLEAGLVACAFCGDGAVSKALMTPNVSVKSNRQAAPSSAVASSQEAFQAELVVEMRGLYQKIRDNFDHVGDEFASLARRIHEGDEAARGIYGNATKDEVEELLDDGIAVLPFPDLPKEH